jgi:hypothetical protein
VLTKNCSSLFATALIGTAIAIADVAGVVLPTVIFVGQPAASAKAASADAKYTFEMVGQPVRTDDHTAISIRLLRSGSDEPVTDAALFYRSLERLSPKTDFGAIRRVKLAPDGRGNYTVLIDGAHEDLPLQLAAELPGGDTIYDTIRLRKN